MAQPLRVAGTDPGTSSLDVLILEDGAVGEQCRFTPEQLQADASLPVRWLTRARPVSTHRRPVGIWSAAGPRRRLHAARSRPDDTGSTR